MAHLHQPSGRFALAILVAMTAVAQADFSAAQSGAPRTTLPDSYAAAMRCFVANGHARTLKLRAGDQTGAARYEDGARASFDAASVVGIALGYSKARMDADHAAYREQELPRMVRDQAYFAEAVTTCRALGLMPQP